MIASAVLLIILMASLLSRHDQIGTGGRDLVVVQSLVLSVLPL